MEHKVTKALLSSAAVGTAIAGANVVSANADAVSVKQAPSIQETQQQSQQAAKNKQAADQAAKTAKQDSIAAQATVDHAQSKADAAQADVAADKQKVADAQADLADSKNGGIEKAKQAVDQAASDLANAQDKNAQAQTALNQANADQKQQQAVTDQAQADYDLAQKQKGQAQSAVDQTQKDLADQQKYAAGLNEKNLNQAQSDAINERIDLENQKSDKEDELESAQAEQDDAQEAVDELQEGDSNDGQEEIDYTKNPHYQEMLDAESKYEELYDVYAKLYTKQEALPNVQLTQENLQDWHKLLGRGQDNLEMSELADTIYVAIFNSFYSNDPDGFEKQYTSFDQLSENDWNVLTNFVLDMVNQARDYWGTAAPHLTSNKVDQEIAKDFANIAIKNYHDDEDDSDYIEVDDDAKQLINEKYHVALGYEFDGENEQVIGDTYDSIAELNQLVGHSMLESGELHEKNAFTMNDLKLEIAGILAGRLTWPADNYLLGEMEKPEGLEWSAYDGDRDNYQPTHLGVSFNHDEIVIVGIDDYDVAGSTPDKVAIPDTPHYADYNQAVKEAEEKADAAQKVVEELWHLVNGTDTEDNSQDRNTLSTRSLTVRAAVSPTQQLEAAQKRLTAANKKVESLTQEIQQLDQQITTSQTKIDEITATLGDLPAKQAEAQQKLTELQDKLTQVQADLTVANKVVTEKKAVLVQAQAELKTVSEQQATAKEVADKASAQVADKTAAQQAAQDYQYRMTHADELLATAKEELAVAEQAVIKAQTELAQAKNKQQAAQAKLDTAQQKQAVANAEYQRAVNATKKAQQEVLNFKHHTKVVLPALHEETVQAATVKSAALPKTGSEQDSHTSWLGLLSLVLSALGLGVFFKEKNPRTVK
ncbi:hypothetical protein LFYK43_10000 [Ligilactobacillus salitolerans]|uniref:Gram-positive cocci surface proteins LPxTG domain-containing protein n=1 Tax=Ligilactobacillus salitolerans TaxID=1808352 RepID=A0A401ISP3_9LACO|nr:LPXTG cell wall anchor domain-containing protein [Ligilactobacillus salitolerans]GBG94541.1 hypothetical protein LFYK43_10000 [Ligilactobacillus salitolerans]